MQYAIYQTSAFFSRALPLSFSYWLGMRIADLYHRCDRRGRAGVAANLRRILAYRGVEPARGAIEGLTRKTYQYFGKYLVDFFRYSRTTCRELQGKVNIERIHYLAEAQAEGRGVLLASGHVGNWEMGGLILSQMGHEVTSVFRTFGNARVNRMFLEQRLNRGFRLIPLGHAVRGLLATLRDRGIAALLVDRDFSGRTDVVEFFGAPARLPRGAARLACRSGAPVVPVFMFRQVDDRFLLRFYPPIHPSDSDGEEGVQRRLTAVLEQAIGKYPHEWFVFEDFWAGRPNGEAQQRGTA